MKRIKYPTEVLTNMWKKNFINETSKFACSTHLKPDDYLSTFKDYDGIEWKILGALEGKELACQNLEDGEVYIWDRWKVSTLRHPDVHAKVEMKREFFYPEKKKGRAKKVDETESQLSLFNPDSND